MPPGGARKEFRNELLSCYIPENEHFSDISVVKTVGKFSEVNETQLRLSRPTSDCKKCQNSHTPQTH